jgi:hypothetical protein
LRLPRRIRDTSMMIIHMLVMITRTIIPKIINTVKNASMDMTTSMTIIMIISMKKKLITIINIINTSTNIMIMSIARIANMIIIMIIMMRRND